MESHARNHDYPTPTKAKIQAVAEFNDARKIRYAKIDLFDHFGVSHRTGWRMLQAESSRRAHHQKKQETRGRKKAISSDIIQQMQEIIENEGIQARAMTWHQLTVRVGLIGCNHVHFDTVRRTMQDLEYHKCLACTRSWLAPNLRMKRRTFANMRLGWKLEDWQRVRFSDEVHFGRGPQRQLMIIRRPGERYCFDCIQEERQPTTEIDRKQKRYHAWAMVGWNYKSDLIFYEVPGNSNGKMSQRVYIDSILNPVVKPCLDANDFVLEEDGDSGHGSANNNNIVRRWKEENKLNYYFNAPKSPDLSIIENCWQPVKQHLSKSDHWDDESTLNVIREGWK